MKLPLFSEFAKDELKHKQVLQDLDAGALDRMLEKSRQNRRTWGLPKHGKGV
ncbi:MAG: hypothetical protein R2875_10700 [Desulfobacterales bacterium]